MMNQFVVFFVLIYQFSFLTAVLPAGCTVDPFAAQAPLLIENGKSSLIYPKHGSRTVTIPNGHSVELSCPQRKVVTNGQPTASIIAATCVSEQTFRVNKGTFLWNQIVCSRDPISTTRATSAKCANNGRSAEIGFILDNRRFLQTMQICFDAKQQITLYSHFNLSNTIAVSSVGTARPSFQENPAFYHLDGGAVNTLYMRNAQRGTINRLLGLAQNSVKYIQNGDLFLARGHLAARADFVYAAQKNSTFKYINAAPQWQTFNGANWNQAEADLRKYADSHKITLQVWTGTYGVATLPHGGSGKDTELYLFVNSNVRAIPVPAIFWKIAYNPVNRRGIVLLGINNPYLDDRGVQENIICKDVSQSVSWLRWNRANIQRGYSYACTVPDFRGVVPYAPSLAVSGLLV